MLRNVNKYNVIVKSLLVAVAALIFLGGFAVVVHAASVFSVPQGGTGVNALKANLIPFGAGISPLATSSDLQFDPSTGKMNVKYASSTAITADSFCIGALCTTSFNTGTVSQINTTYPVTGGPITTAGTIALAFGTTTANTWSLLQTFTNSSTTFASFGYASSTLYFGANLATCTGTNALTWTGGIFGCQAQPQGTVTSVTGTWPVISSGGATPAISFGGLSTSSPAVISNIPYFSGVNTFANVATTSLGISAPITFSGTLGAQIGGGAGSFGCTSASLTVTGCLTAANFQTFNNKVGTSSSATAGQVAYFTTTNGTPALISGVATNTLTASGVVQVTNSPVIIGASSAAITVVGGANGQVLGWSGGAPTWVGTTTAGTGLTFNTGSPGNLSVNTSQNISTLSNLTNNGFVQTTGNTGALSVQQFPITIAEGGTATTTGGVIGGVEFWNGAILTNNAGFTYDGNGNAGIGSTTPWANFSIASSTYSYKNPLFAVSTSTDLTGILANIFATSSTLSRVQQSVSDFDSGVRFVIGAINQYGFPGFLDQLFVNGRINTGDWHTAFCEILQIGSTGSNFQSVCGPWGFSRDATGSIANNWNDIRGLSTITICTVVNCDTAAAAANVGAGLFLTAGVNTFAPIRPASSTPVMEFTGRISTPTTASSTRFTMGFANVDPGGTTFEIEPTAGCYFVASTSAASATTGLANWQAECRTAGSAANTTTVDTGFSSTTSTVNNAGSFYRFRIEMDNDKAQFYMQSSTSPFKKVATISTNYPGTAPLRAELMVSQTAAGFGKAFDITGARLWWLEDALRY